MTDTWSSHDIRMVIWQLGVQDPHITHLSTSNALQEMSVLPEEFFLWDRSQIKLVVCSVHAFNYILWAATQEDKGEARRNESIDEEKEGRREEKEIGRKKRGGKEGWRSKRKEEEDRSMAVGVMMAIMYQTEYFGAINVTLSLWTSIAQKAPHWL